MQLSDLSVKRPVFAAVVALLMAVVGAVSFFGLSVREYPDTDPPIVSVETRYIGAAASVVETRVTQVLEERLAGIEGLQTITSRSRVSSSEFDEARASRKVNITYLPDKPSVHRIGPVGTEFGNIIFGLVVLGVAGFTAVSRGDGAEV